MAHEQYFVQCGRTGQIGLVVMGETTKWILRTKIKVLTDGKSH